LNLHLENNFKFPSRNSEEPKLFAVSWESLNYNRGDYILKVDKPELREAEGLDKEV